MSVRTDDPNSNRQFSTSQSEGISSDELEALRIVEEAEAVEAIETIEAIEVAKAAEVAEAVAAAEVAEAAAKAKKLIREISGKTDGLSDDINKLQGEIKALKKEIRTLKQENKNTKSENQKLHEKIRDLESSRDKLQKQLEISKTTIDKLRIEIEEKTAKNSKENQFLMEAMKSENKKLKLNLEDLTKRLATFGNEIGNLKAENHQLRENLAHKETRLALGQVAWLLEKEIWRAVLPHKKMGKTGILRSMKQWLKRNSSKPEGKEAQKRWDDLKEKLNWDEDDHIYGLKQLKGIRNEEAHPEPVDLEAARKELKEGDYVADTDKEICEKIIDMVITARKLNSSMK